MATNQGGQVVASRPMPPHYHAQGQPQQPPPGPPIHRKRPDDGGGRGALGKKKRPTVLSMPDEPSLPESELYGNLRDFERRLDWTVTRKKAELAEVMERPIRSKRTLRVFLSSFSYNQGQGQGQGQQQQVEAGQSGGALGSMTESSGQSPGWTLRIEGRLLDVPGVKYNKQTRPFSTFIHSCVIELSPYGKPNLERFAPSFVEWRRSPQVGLADGFEIKRANAAGQAIGIGNTDLLARVILRLDDYPEKLRMLSPLAEILGYDPSGHSPLTRSEISYGLWQYVNLHRLQDSEDRRAIKCDAALLKLSRGQPKVWFSQLSQIADQHIVLADSVVLEHVIRPVQDSTTTSPSSPNRQAFDIEIDLDDGHVKGKIGSTLQSLQDMREVHAIDDSIATQIHHLNNARTRRDFFEQFSSDPKGFIDEWIRHQSADLEVIYGDTRVNLEQRRRAEFWKSAWVDEQVTLALSRINSKSLERLQAK